MSYLLPELAKDRHAMLLMYLADELLPEDRAQVDFWLTEQADLRASLEELREANDRLMRAMAVGDAGIGSQASRCANETIRAMRRWQATTSTESAAPAIQQLPLPWWCYPLAAAAAIFVAATVFFANLNPPVDDHALWQATTATERGSDLLESSIWNDVPAVRVADQYALAEELVSLLDETDDALALGLGDSAFLAAAHEVRALESLSESAFASVDWRW